MFLEPLEPSKKTTMTASPQATHLSMVDWFNKNYDYITVITDRDCSYCKGKGKEGDESCYHCDGSGDDSIYELEGIQGNIYQLYHHFSPSKSLAVFLASFGIEAKDTKFYMRPAVWIGQKDVQKAYAILSRLKGGAQIFQQQQTIIACSEVAQ